MKELYEKYKYIGFRKWRKSLLDGLVEGCFPAGGLFTSPLSKNIQKVVLDLSARLFLNNRTSAIYFAPSQHSINIQQIPSQTGYTPED